MIQLINVIDNNYRSKTLVMTKIILSLVYCLIICCRNVLFLQIVIGKIVHTYNDCVISLQRSPPAYLLTYFA